MGRGRAALVARPGRGRGPGGAGWRAGGRAEGGPAAEPFALMLAGEHRAAADRWQELGCPLWAAYSPGLLRPGPRRAGLPGDPGPPRAARGPRGGAARPARPRPDGAARPAAVQPGQPVRADHPGGRGPRPAGRGAVVRRGRAAPGAVPQDGQPPRVRGAAQARRAQPDAGGRHRAAPRAPPARLRPAWVSPGWRTWGRRPMCRPAGSCWLVLGNPPVLRPVAEETARWRCIWTCTT